MVTTTKASIKFGAWGGPYQTVTAPLKVTATPINRSATGYGPKLPTPYMIQWEGRWRRVYVACYSNSGTPWASIAGERVVVDVELD